MSYVLDKDGYLVDRVGWSTAVAEEMAADDLMVLSEDRWVVINYLREYYFEYQISPAMRVLARAMGKRLGGDKGNSKYLYELFPYGPVKQASRYAGLPKPTGCM